MMRTRRRMSRLPGRTFKRSTPRYWIRRSSLADRTTRAMALRMSSAPSSTVRRNGRKIYGHGWTPLRRTRDEVTTRPWLLMCIERWKRLLPITSRPRTGHPTFTSRICFRHTPFPCRMLTRHTLSGTPSSLTRPRSTRTRPGQPHRLLLLAPSGQGSVSCTVRMWNPN